MHKPLAAAVAAISVVAALPVQAQQAGVIRVGDNALTCQQIVAEAGQLSQTLGGAPEGGVFSSEQAISAATSVGIQAAMMSGAGSIIPGVGLLGNALGAAARRDRERREAERVVARQRWYYLNGVYSGRDCDRLLAQPAEAPVAEAPAEAAPASEAGATPADTD